MATRWGVNLVYICGHWVLIAILDRHLRPDGGGGDDYRRTCLSLWEGPRYTPW